MRKILTMSLAATALLTAGAFVSTGASAAPGSPSTGLSDAVRQNGLAQNVVLVCRRVWRNGFLVRRCYDTPGYYGYGYYAPRPYYGYGYGYGRGWRYGYGRRW